MHHDNLKADVPFGIALALFIIASMLPLAFATDYRTAPPYSNQGSSPQSGTCVLYTTGKVCAVMTRSNGVAKLYALDTGSRLGYLSWGRFNGDPVPGNSPQVYLSRSFTTSSLQYWNGYTYAAGSAETRAYFILYLYYWRITPYAGWYLSSDQCLLYYLNNGGGKPFYYYGRVSCVWSSPPNGAATYTVFPFSKLTAFAMSGSTSYADFYTTGDRLINAMDVVISV